MISFERTEKEPKFGDVGYDGVKLEISGGYETPLDEYIHYFVTFMEALTFPREGIINALHDFVADNEDGNITD